MCLKEIREEHENEEDHYMECSTSDKDKQLQQATSTEMEGSYLSEAREPPSITNSNQSFTFSHDIQHLNEYLKIIGERNLR